jgi:hypothetical protein
MRRLYRAAIVSLVVYRNTIYIETSVHAGVSHVAKAYGRSREGNGAWEIALLAT